MEHSEIHSRPEDLNNVVITFFKKDVEKILSDALGMSLLKENKKNEIVAVYNKFLQDLIDPVCVEERMVYFDKDEDGNMFRLKNEDGSYDLEVAIQIFLGGDYLGREMLSLFNNNTFESREIYKYIQEQLYKKLNENN